MRVFLYVSIFIVITICSIYLQTQPMRKVSRTLMLGDICSDSLYSVFKSRRAQTCLQLFEKLIKLFQSSVEYMQNCKNILHITYVQIFTFKQHHLRCHSVQDQVTNLFFGYILAVERRQAYMQTYAWIIARPPEILLPSFAQSCYNTRLTDGSRTKMMSDPNDAELVISSILYRKTYIFILWSFSRVLRHVILSDILLSVN